MIIVNPGSINDLLSLHEHGVPVTLTSHPGNASLYKLSLWSCGIPEHLWDVTCMKADANNWPMHELRGGEARLLVSPELYARVVSETTQEKRFVTAYQHTATGDRLGRYHVRVMQRLFPDTVKTVSELLLSEKELLRSMFEYLADTREDVFTRYIDGEGVLRPIRGSSILRNRYAETFIRVLEELDHLLNSDAPITTKGGACYDGVMVPLATMLVQYWKTGEVVRADVSGPDMIHYATRPAHVEATQEMLEHLRKWSPRFIPKGIHVQMYPGTLARVGYVPGHISEAVMRRKRLVSESDATLTKERRQALCEEAREDNLHWPVCIDPKRDCYFSQHDLAALGQTVVVDDFWKSIPILNFKEVLGKANGMLRIRG